MVISRERGSVRPRSSSELHIISLLFLGEKSEGFSFVEKRQFFFLSFRSDLNNTHFARFARARLKAMMSTIKYKSCADITVARAGGGNAREGDSC